MKLLAIDIGASSGRAIEGELHADRLDLKEVHRFKNEMVEHDGHKHWDVHRLRAELRTALKNADPAVESVGIDTWGVDYGYVSTDGEIIGLPFAYRDERNQVGVDIVHRQIPFDRLYAINGLQSLPFNTIYQVAEDLKSRPNVPAAADRLLMMPELLSWSLTGRYAAEYSIASTSGLLDARTGRWSPELLDLLNFPRHLFTDVSQPGAFTAPLRRETRHRAALICPACHDTASAVAATPLDSPDAVYISSGTWSLVGMELDRPVLTDAARDAHFTNEGGVAHSIRFLKNIMGLWLIQEVQRLCARDGATIDFASICDEAKLAPPFASIIDPNHPRFLAPLDMRLEIQDECRRTGQTPPQGVGPLARCVFDSLALAYRDCIEQLDRLTGRRPDRIHVVGGGVQNRLLCQMTADACALPVYAGPVEATAIGNLLVQAISLGAVSDIRAARRIVRNSFPLETYSPHDPVPWQHAWDRYRNLVAKATAG